MSTASPAPSKEAIPVDVAHGRRVETHYSLDVAMYERRFLEHGAYEYFIA